MKILFTTLSQIMNAFPKAPPETGGIIGCSSDGIICSFMFDPGCANTMQTEYVPDICLLNAVIKKWREQGLFFCGIIHSHFSGVEVLSPEDKAYIQDILRSMPATVSHLYFPIIIPKNKILPFVASRNTNGIIIQEDTLQIIK